MPEKLTKNSQCLMIKTKDSRKFFTHKKNFTPLMQFSKLFKAEISIVQTKEAEILDLKELAPALCDCNFKQPEPEYQIIEVKMTQRQRSEIRKNAKSIQEYIENQFIRGELVSLRELKRIFGETGITNACLCNHLSQVRRNLEKKGYVVLKQGGGKYRITPKLAEF